MLRTCATALAALVTTSVTLGDLQINQWNPNITSGFTIDENRRIITITSGHPTEVFKFEAYDDSNNEPETINEITVETGAVFRLAAEPTVVDPLASFVCAPQGGEADEPDAGTFVAGAFSPVDSLYDFEPELINLCWFDRVDSPDGPAAIMRLVIDVSGVSGADTSDGFGSVYFSQDGPHGADDIKVADFISATGTRFDVENITGLTGEFFVTGG